MSADRGKRPAADLVSKQGGPPKKNGPARPAKPVRPASDDPVALSRMLLRAMGYAVLPLTALPGAGPDLVGIDLAGGRMLGVLAADGRAGLLPKLVATLGCRSLGRLLAAGRLRIELHLWERRYGKHVCHRTSLTAADWGEG